jgi:hypothetical protein
MTAKEYIWRAKVAGTVSMAAVALFGMCMYTLARSPAPTVLPLRVHVGEEAPNFSLLSADGGTVSLSDFRGHNVLLDIYEGFW